MKKKIKIFFVITILTITACAKSNNQQPTGVSMDSANADNDQDDNQYVAGSDDVPLFAGLVALDEEDTSFDTMSGNIAISTYVGNFTEQQIKDFYDKSLPQMGWKMINGKGKLFYKRDNDRLEISFKVKKNQLHVKFFISSVLKN